MIGKTLLHYRIKKKLGEGGMGVVYLAEDIKLERKVALKFLPRRIAGSREQRRRFEIEAKAAAALNHANIATIYDIQETDGELFIVMEYIEGKELKQIIKDEKWDINRIVEAAVQIGKGLQAAHEKGIVHRDVKSSNIMVTEKGEVKIMDFGLARLPGSSQVTKTGTTAGTIAYMSPEQLSGKNADQRADIWSFGVVLFEMLTGRLPFQGDYEQAMMYAIVNEQPQPVQGLVPEIPSVLIHLLDRMLEKDENLRYQSISDVLLELRRLEKAAGESTGSHRTQDSIRVESPDRPAKRKKTALPFAFAILVTAAIALLIVLNPFSRSGPDEPMKIVPFTSLPGMEMFPAISPDGREIAFCWNGGEGPNFDIYVQIIGTLDAHKLTDQPASHSHPVWTPDGRSIMFIRFRPETAHSISGTVQFVQIPARGGTEKILLEVGNITPSPSPNPYDIAESGNEYITLIWDGAFKLAAFDATAFATISKDTVTNPPVDYLGDAYPLFSPDGLRLAFMRGKYDFNFGDIHVMDYPDGEAARVSGIDGKFAGFSWMPDGNEIVYSADEQLFRVSIDDGKVQPIILTSGIRASQPSVSPTGDRMAFVQRTIKWADLYLLDITDPASQSARPRKIFSSSLDERYGRISPDGERIVFVTNRTGKMQIWIGNIDGSSANPIADLPGPEFSYPVWSPDGSLIAYDGDGLNVISSFGGSPRSLIKEGVIFPRFSANGEWIYYTSYKAGESQIWRVPLSGGEAVQVTKNGAEVGYESADGKWLYYSRFWLAQKTGIYKIPVEGGEEFPVIEKPIPRRGWKLSDDGIYYITLAFGRYEMFFFNFADSQTAKIREDYLYDSDLDGYFDVSPDGSTLIFAEKGRPESDIMLIENFR